MVFRIVTAFYLYWDADVVLVVVDLQIKTAGTVEPIHVLDIGIQRELMHDEVGPTEQPGHVRLNQTRFISSFQETIANCLCHLDTSPSDYQYEHGRAVVNGGK